MKNIKGNSGLLRCRRPFYSLWIIPDDHGRMIASTCRWNTYIRGNAVVCESGVSRSWNSEEFVRQRKRVLNGDWGFCGNSSCVPLPFLDQAAQDAEVQDALSNSLSVLAYQARVLTVAVSFACNLNCGFCRQQLKARHRLNLAPSAIEELKSDIIPGAERIVVTGGEPFFAPQATQLIDFIISSYPAKELRVITNGALLHEYGIKRILESRMRLRISLYGMSDSIYKRATGSGVFSQVYGNICSLISCGYDKAELYYLATGSNDCDIPKFCSFVESNPGLRAIVANNRYEGRKKWRIMKRYEDEFRRLSPRLKFEYRDEGLLVRMRRALPFGSRS